MQATIRRFLLALGGIALGGCGWGPDVGQIWEPLWCGRELCGWKVDSGEARPVPFWHEGDPALGLSGGGSVSWRIEPYEPVGEALCLRLEVASQSAGQVRFEVDLDDDGSVDRIELLGGRAWEIWKHESRLPVARKVTRYRMAFVNDGTSEAVFYPRVTSLYTCWPR